MKIILSTDFSEGNKSLHPYAIDLLKNSGGEIIIFHAYMDHVFMGGSVYPGNMDSDNYFTNEILIEQEKISRQEMKNKTKYLVDLIKKEGADNIKVRSLLVSGEPETELIELSKKEKPDLILMGTRGKGGKRFLEGSLAKSIMTKINVPMLSIPENYHWRKSTDILYATNFGKYDILAINKIFNILKPYKPHVHVIHFVEDSDKPKESILMEELEQSFNCKEVDGTIHFQLIHTENPSQALKIFCEQNDISMTSFIAYRKGFWDFIFRDKINKEDFFKIGLPMLTFKEI